MKKISYKQWLDQYKPIINHFVHFDADLNNLNDTDLQFHFQSEEEWQFIKDHIGSNKLWTLVSHENGGFSIMSGKIITDRVCYYITSIPYEGEIEIVTNEGCPEIDKEDLYNFNFVREHMSDAGEKDLDNSLNKIMKFLEYHTKELV